MLLCVSKAAEFSPDWGRKKITSSGDGKRLAFPYDEAQGQLIVGVVVLNKALPAQAVSALSTSQIWLIAMAVLAVLDTILLSVSLVRFRRSHLLFF